MKHIQTFSIVLLLITAILIPLKGTAQTTFSQEIVITTSQADGVYNVLAFNVDGQNRPEIVAANRGSENIVYFQNQGEMQFSTGLTVTTNISRISSIVRNGKDIYSGFDQGIGVHDNNNFGTFSFSVYQKSLNNPYYDPYALSIGDIDGDGNQDLLFIEPLNNVDKNIHIMFTVENSIASSHQKFNVQSASDLSADDVIAADMDGDGDLDLIVGSETTNNVHWLENTGNRNFGAPTVITQYMYDLEKVLASDFDEDGDLDLFVLRNDRVVLIKNNGGSFANPVLLSYLSTGRDFKMGDINNDDRLDLVVADEGNIIWFPNNGSGGFESASTISSSGARSIALADLRGDGDLDIVAGVFSEDKIVVFENFTLGPSNQPPTANNDTYSTDQNVELFVPAEDGFLNNDSDPEGSALTVALVEDVSNGSLSIGGGGSFTYTPDNGFHGEDSFIYSITDSEGAKSEATVTITVNEGPANDPPVASDDSYVTNQGEILSVSAENGVLSNDTDPDGDELTPSVATTVSNGSLDLSEDGSFTYTPNEGYFGKDSFTYSITDELGASDEATVTITVNYFLFTQSMDIAEALPGNMIVFTADLDNDGLSDLLTGSSENGELVWIKNYGNGAFGNKQIISTEVPSLHGVFAADIDGDGDLDALSASRDNNRVAWYENDGDGNFGSANVIHSSGTPTYVHAADIDGDGDQDVLIATVGSDDVLIYFNDGGGSFEENIDISSESNPMSVITDDLDGDGDLDVIFSANQYSKVLWAENNGDGSFAANAELTRRADGVWGIHSIDIDGDGDIDVLSASDTDNKLAWYTNRGDTDPRFSRPVQHVILDTFTGARDITAGDLDMDGDIDVVGAAKDANKISLFVNNGSQNFQEIVLSSDANEASHVVLEDMDNDGDLDIVASLMSGKVVWFENLMINTENPIDPIPIADARAVVDGAPIKIQGTITTPDFGFNSAEFYLQDNSGGLLVYWNGFGGGNTETPFEEGQVITISGTRATFESQAQLNASDYSLVSSDNELPDASVITSSDWNVSSSLMGSRVTIQNVSLVEEEQWPTDKINSGSGVNVDVEDTEGNVFVLRIDRDESFFDESPAPTGTFHVSGIMGRFNDDIQLYPFFETDIVAAETGVSNETEEQISHFRLQQNYPNPFNPTTNIRFDLPQSTQVTLKVYDMLGREVATLLNKKSMSTGVHSITFNAADLTSGIYIYRIQAGNHLQTRTMALIK